MTRNKNTQAHAQDPSEKLLTFCVSNIYKCLANAKRPCDCSVLCLRQKSSLCSYPHSTLDMTSFGSADSMRRASMDVDATTV